MIRNNLARRTYGLPVNVSFDPTVLFYIAFAINVLRILILSTTYAPLIEASYVNILFIALRLSVWVLLGVKIATQRYSARQLAISLLFIILFAVIGIFAGRVLEMLLFIIAGQNVKIRRLAQISLSITLVGVTIIAITALMGITENVQIASDLKDAPAGRNSLGFSHPNALGCSVFTIVLAWLVLNYKKLSLTNALVVLLGAVGVFLISESETYTIAILLAGLLHLLSRVLSARFLAASAIACTGFIAGFSFYAMFTFDPKVPLWNTLDGHLSHRLTLARHYFLTYPNSLFGQSFADARVSWFPSGNGRLLVDNAYCHLWLQYGIVMAIVFVALVIAVFVKSFRENRWNEVTFGLLVSIIVGFGEIPAIKFNTDYFLIAVAALIFGMTLRSFETSGEEAISIRNYFKKSRAVDGGQDVSENVVTS